ncbi:CHAT domain-containing protein [Fodinibius sp. Rm-B-1B1-1]|uniref:CHAT domain-containing protein n=1 Tax=Fodinibius alkaliphilus TaxID=3140241 RepID=UPI00315AA1DB
MAKKIVSVFLCFALFSAIPFLGWAQEHPNDTSSADNALQKADSLQHAARYDSSSHFYQQAAKLYEKQNKFRQQRRALLEISKNKRTQDSYDAAADFLEQSWQISKQHFPEDQRFRLPYLHQKGRLAEGRAQYETALTHFRDGLSLADSLRNQYWVAQFKTGIGEVYTSQGNYDQAISVFSEAQDIYHRNNLDDRTVISRIYNSRGIAHQQMGAYEHAFEYFTRSLEIDQQRLPHPHPEIAKGFNNLALIYFYESDYQRALEYMINATDVLSSFHGENHRLVAAGHNNIGIVYSEIGEMQKSAEHLEKSLTIKENVLGQNHPELAIGYQNLGALHFDIQQYDKAITFYQKSEQIHLQNFPDGHPELANVYANLGQAYTQKGSYDKALDFYFQDLDINRRMLSEDHPFIGDTYSKVGQVYANMENHQQALQYYTRALNILITDFSWEAPFRSLSLSNTVYPELVLTTLRLKAESHYKLGNTPAAPKELEKALHTYLQTVDFIDDLQQSLHREESKFLLRERTTDIYSGGFKTAHALWEHTGSPEYKEHLFYFSQKSRNQVLLEQIQSEQNQRFAQLPDSLIDKEHHLRTTITDLQQQLSTYTNRKEIGDSLQRFSLRDSLFHTQKSLESHLKQLKQNYPKYYGLKYHPPVAKIKEIQKQHLSSSQTLISYFSGDDHLWAFIINRDSFDIQQVNSDTLLEDKVRSFRDALTNSQTIDPWATQSYNLYQQLIAPLKNNISGNQLLVIPAGPLHYLPFEALLTKPVESPSNKRVQDLSYLVNDFSISYVPSVGYLELQNQQPDRDSQKMLAGFAPAFNNTSVAEQRERFPEEDRPLSPLLFNKTEVQTLEELFNDRSGLFSFLRSKKKVADSFVDQKATESTFKAQHLQDYRYIHLATHAFLREENPGQSGILFSTPDENENGTLYTSEIYNLDLQAKLVTLSACNTGMGTLKKGEGLIGFSRAFQYAGAKNLLVSLWRVNDRSTAKLMIDFYQLHHKEGHTMNEALQQAKQQMIENVEYAHPKYWAPFILIGE